MDNSSSEEDREKRDHIPGIRVRKVIHDDAQTDHVFVVGWEGDHDPMRPQNWSLTRRWIATAMLCLISMVVSAASSIDAAVTPQSSEAFNVDENVGPLTTGKNFRFT